ncbi:hypothetical protein C1646_749525 [Rhizophagus diaphanus]|nr:hypothetical protein C1646_749525 [Rhizophagus diaphanus] [Rhizophagus sp. MUCL 43196]
MHSFYENIISKKGKNKNKRKNTSEINESNPNKIKEWDFVKKNIEIYSKCINIIMKSNQIIDIINKSVKDLNPDTEDYNFQQAICELTSKIKDSMKFSYLLYYYVLIFRYIALISPPTTDQVKLLKYLKLKDFNENIEKFNLLRSKPLGKDIIQANNIHRKTILTVILNCAKTLNINNEKLKNGLSMINSNYLFKDYTEPAKNGYNKSSKKARLAFNAFGTSNTDNDLTASSSTNNSINKQRFRKEKQRQYEFDSYKSQIEALQSELRNFKSQNKPNNRINHGKNVKLTGKQKQNRMNHIISDKDESLHDRINMIGHHKPQSAVLNTYGIVLENYSFGEKFNQEQLIDMQNKVVTIINSLNKETIEEITNAANHMIQFEMENLSISQEDKAIISNYQALYKFVNNNHFEIVSEKDKENYNTVVKAFQKEDFKDVNENYKESPSNLPEKYNDLIEAVFEIINKDSTFTAEIVNNVIILNNILFGLNPQLDDDTVFIKYINQVLLKVLCGAQNMLILFGSYGYEALSNNYDILDLNLHEIFEFRKEALEYFALNNLIELKLHDKKINLINPNDYVNLIFKGASLV